MEKLRLAKSLSTLSIKPSKLFTKTCKKVAGDIEKLQTQITNREIRKAKEGKIDENKQYDSRQNLEIAGISLRSGENTNKIVQQVAELINVNLFEDQISTSHRLPASQRPNRGNTKNKNRLIASSPPIIAQISGPRCPQ